MNFITWVEALEINEKVYDRYCAYSLRKKQVNCAYLTWTASICLLYLPAGDCANQGMFHALKFGSGEQILVSKPRNS